MNLHDGLSLSSSIGMADIHYMKQQSGFSNLLKGGSEGSHQLRGQLLNEPHCISQQNLRQKPSKLWSRMLRYQTV